MKYFGFIICFLIVPFIFEAQQNVLLSHVSQKLKLEHDSLSKILKIEKRNKGLGNAMLTFYQKHVSVLISANCLYSKSCSRFAKAVVDKHGLFVGTLLSVDRLSRCSYMCLKDVPVYKLQNNGLVEDNP